MAKRVLSIEVGECITRVVEMDYMAKLPRIYNAFCFETPQDTINEEGVKINEDIIALMKQGLRQKGIRTNKVVFTVSSTRIANRDVTIPMVKDNKIKQVLLANSRDYFPVDLAQYELVYRIVERQKEEKQIKLSVLAIPRTLITSYTQLAKVWGFQVVGMDYSGNSAYQAITRIMNPALTITVHVDDTSSMLTVIKDGKAEFQRTIGYGIDSAVEVVRSSRELGENLSYLDAMDVMRNRNCFNSQLRMEEDSDDWGELEDEAVMNVRGEATRAMSMLVNNLMRVLDYYTSKNQELEFDKVILTGPGAECRGLDRLLTNELSIAVTVLQDTKSVSLSRSLMRGKFKLSEYMIVVGATFDPLNFAMETEEGKAGNAAGSKDSMALSIIVFVGCLAISAVLVLLPFLENLALETANAVMRREIDQRLEIVDVYNRYVKLKKADAELLAADHNSDVPNDVFLEFLAEMEMKMPTDLTVDSLSVSGNIITISAVCTSRRSVAYAIMQLRTFDTILDVSCGAVTESEGESGVTEERFTITLTYFEGPREMESQEPENAAESEEAGAENAAEPEDTENGAGANTEPETDTESEAANGTETDTESETEEEGQDG